MEQTFGATLRAVSTSLISDTVPMESSSSSGLGRSRSSGTARGRGERCEERRSQTVPSGLALPKEAAQKRRTDNEEKVDEDADASDNETGNDKAPAPVVGRHESVGRRPSAREGEGEGERVCVCVVCVLCVCVLLSKDGERLEYMRQSLLVPAIGEDCAGDDGTKNVSDAGVRVPDAHHQATAVSSRKCGGEKDRRQLAGRMDRTCCANHIAVSRAQCVRGTHRLRWTHLPTTATTLGQPVAWKMPKTTWVKMKYHRTCTSQK